MFDREQKHLDVGKKVICMSSRKMLRDQIRPALLSMLDEL